MRFNPKLTIALAVTLLACMGISLPYPVLTPLFIGAEPSALNQYAGLAPEILLTIIISIYPLGIFIGSSFIGALSDRYGRKSVLAKTLVICFVGYLVSAYALVQQDFLLLLISRFLTGITEGNVAIARAIALDIGGEETNTKNKVSSKTSAISLINSAVFLGWLLGPLIGGLLAEYEASYAMLAAAVGAVICYLLVKLFLTESLQSEPKEFLSVWRAVIKENSFQLLRNRWVRHLFYAYLVYTLAVNLFYEFYPIWLVDVQGFGPLDIGLATTNMTIFMTLSSIFLVTKMQSKFGLVSPMRFSMLLLAVCLSIVPSTFGLTTHINFAICGVLLALFNGMLPVYISEQEPDAGNGSTMGLLTMTFCLANVFAAIIGGGLLLLNSSFPLYLSAGLFVVAAIGFEAWLFRANSQADKIDSEVNSLVD